MRRQGRIVDIDGGGPDSALIELDSVSQCLRCSRGEGCGAMMLNSQADGVQFWVTIATERAQLVNGQSVTLEIDDQGSGWLWSVFAAYGLPLMGMLLATALSTLLIGNELLVAVSAVVGLCGGIFAWRQVAPAILSRACRGLCLHSARIVSMSPSPLKRVP